MNDLNGLREQRRAIVARARARGASVLNDAEDEAFRRLSDEIEEAEPRDASRSYADRIFRASQASKGQAMTAHTPGIESRF
jgi:vacuolar-type H+-ATPase subunit H